jgi:hypothetical protein
MCRCVAVSAPAAVLEVATESAFTIYLSGLLAKTIDRLLTVSYRWQLYAVRRSDRWHTVKLACAAVLPFQPQLLCLKLQQSQLSLYNCLFC